jgi:pimeloyl-ACP methyl ester carboxylesterase
VRTLYTHARMLALAAFREVVVLVICGDRDVLTPLEQSRAIVAELPDSELVVVENAGHVVLLEHPEIVNAALASFLRRVS